MSIIRTVHLVFAVVLLTTPVRAADPWGTLLGDGCAHPVGGTPGISLSGPAFLGDPDFEVLVNGVPAGSNAWLLFSWTSVEWSPWQGCEMFIDPSQMILLPMDEDSPGNATWGMPLPDHPSLAGAAAFVQAAAIGSEIGVSAGLAFTMEHAECWWGSMAFLAGSGDALVPTYGLMSGAATDSGLPSQMTFLPIGLSGLSDTIEVDHAGANQVDWNGDDPTASEIDLGHVGTLHRYLDPTTGRTGLLVARRDTALLTSIVDSGSAPQSTVDETVAVSPDGRQVAVVRSGAFLSDELVVASTDGVPVHGGAFSVSVPVFGFGVEIDPASVVFAGDHLVFLGTPTLFGGSPSLYSAPADGSGTALPLAMPQLGDGSFPTSIDPILLPSDTGLIAVVARSATASDVLIVDPPTGTVANVTQFQPTRTIEPFGGDDLPRRGAFSRDGARVFVTAVTGGVRDGFVAFTRGGVPGEPMVYNLTHDFLFDPSLTEISAPHFASFGAILVRVGLDATSGDYYRFRVHPGVGVSLVENVTGTSGDEAAPFFPPGNVGRGATFQPGGRPVVFAVDPQPVFALSDLIAIDLTAWQVTSITGSKFNPTSQSSFQEIRVVKTARSVDDQGRVEQRTLVVLEPLFGAPSVIALDANRPQDGATHVFSPPFGADLGDVMLRRDGARAILVQRNGDQSVVHAFDWETLALSQVTLVPGVISRGSVHWVHTGFDTIAYAVGTNDPIHPTDAIVEHLSVETGARKAVTTVASNVYFLAGAEESIELDLTGFWAGNVDHTYVGVGRESFMRVTINDYGSPVPENLLTVTIEGNGPTFKDGSVTKTVPQVKGTTKFDLKAGDKPGCYTVRIENRSLASRINVIRVTPTFNPGPVVSSDNECAHKDEAADLKLGAETSFNDGLQTNTMEVRFALEPKEDCVRDTKYEIRRLAQIGLFQDGCHVIAPFGFHDDPDNDDEDLTPSDDYHIYSLDAPGLGNSFLPVGTIVEQHNLFIEQVEVFNKQRFEKLTDDFRWESRVVVKQLSPSEVKHIPGTGHLKDGWTTVDLNTPLFPPLTPCGN